MPAVIDVHHRIPPDFFFVRGMTRTRLAALHRRHGAKPALWNSWMTPGIDADHVDPAPTDRRAG
jgi:hypothetical protein